ncbi:MAG: IS5 family transposase [Patescibacteria group bacterium]
MKKPTKARKHGGKKQYKVRNWREYNQALVDRGKIIFWVTDEALRQWREQKKTGKRGKPRLYSNLAIETALTLGQVFHIPLRQVEGFLGSILLKMGSVNKSPDYSTLSVRAENLSVSIRVRSVPDEPLHIVVDSTGAKVYGEGEWKVRQHGWSKRRTWQKLHLGIDEKTGDILLGEVTGNDTADCEVLPSLLAQVPAETKIVQVSADGAYDKRICYEALKKRVVNQIAIPPQRNARIIEHGNSSAPPFARDENLRRIRRVGRKRWKEEVGYHRRSLAENAMFRLKTIFTDKVRSRKKGIERVELLIRVRALNLMTTLGMPKSYVVA